jgi:two-component system chemotaxis response regulator CheB
VVGVVASAGGVEALKTFVAGLPADFPAAVLVVLHIPPSGPSVLPDILSGAGKLPARHPEDGEALETGVILVAPPGRHLAIADGHARLLAGPRENGHRPSADTLLRSVARNFGPAGSGVVLSGTMDDGAAGLAAVRRLGGLALVQDPAEATFAQMPAAAIRQADPQYAGPVAALPERLLAWLHGLDQEAHVAYQLGAAAADPELTPFTCFECGGTLWLRDDYGAQQLRCRVGHAFSVEGLLLDKRSALERALWAAVVALDERADLSRRVIKRLEGSGRTGRADRYRTDIDVAERQAAFLRVVISDLIDAGGTTYDDGNAEADSA